MDGNKITADYVIRTPEDAEGVAQDVREVILECLEDGTETAIEIYDRPLYDEQGFQTCNTLCFAFFPGMSRGACWCNGGASWADASSLDDLVAAADDPDRWSN